ncbi:MAG: c-type cytochrome [Methyloligellaceae bacterium]
MRVGLWFLILGMVWLAAGSDPNAAERKPEQSAPALAPAGANAARAKARRDADLVGHGGPVRAIALGRDGRRALTGSFDYAMMYWDLTGPKPKILSRFTDHDAAVNAVRFLPGDERALSGSDDGTLGLWDLGTGKLIHRFKGHSAKVVDVAVSPDGRFAASASWDRTVRVWNLETRQPGPVLSGHTGPVNAVAFAVDASSGRLYSAGYDGTVRIWDLASGELKRTLYRHGWGINCLKALPDAGKLLFGALDGQAGVLDVDSGKVSTVLAPHEGPVLALAVRGDAGLAATGGADGVVNVWASDRWAQKERHTNPYGPIWGLAFSPDGKRVYYSGLDDFVTVWQVQPRKPFEDVASPFPRRFQVTKDMSLGERQFARKCSVCHTLKPDDGNRAGPTLYKLFGRKAGSLPGYPYSDALKESDIIWNERTIGLLFDHGPQRVTPGTKMPLQQILDPRKREALIAYLKTATSGGSEPEGRRQGEPQSSREQSK